MRKHADSCCWLCNWPRCRQKSLGGRRWRGPGSVARAALFHPETSPAATASPRPNILVIAADELGYMDINACAARVTGIPAQQQFCETPNMDRSVRAGMAFSQAYASQLCSPTRAGFLTGRNAAQIGVTTATPGSVKTFYNQGRAPLPGYLAQDAIYWGDPISIPRALLNGSTLDALPCGQPLDRGRDDITLAEALTGHRSAVIGKWPLGNHGAKGWQPAGQGFYQGDTGVSLCGLARQNAGAANAPSAAPIANRDYRN